MKCGRCREILDGRLDRYNELSLEYEEQRPLYYCRKLWVGSGPCFQVVATMFKSDTNRNLLDCQVSGGEFVQKFRR